MILDDSTGFAEKCQWMVGCECVTSNKELRLKPLVPWGQILRTIDQTTSKIENFIKYYQTIGSNQTAAGYKGQKSGDLHSSQFRRLKIRDWCKKINRKTILDSIK